MKSDTEIADSTVLEEIDTIARKAGIPAENLFHYGPYIAKVPLKLINDHKAKKSHLILVTAITATRSEEHTSELQSQQESRMPSSA